MHADLPLGAVGRKDFADGHVIEPVTTVRGSCRPYRTTDPLIDRVGARGDRDFQRSAESCDRCSERVDVRRRMRT